MFDSDGFVSDGSEDDLDFYAWSHVCCPLRGQSQYPNLSHFELKYTIGDLNVLSILFHRHDTSPTVKLVFGTKSDETCRREARALAKAAGKDEEEEVCPRPDDDFEYTYDSNDCFVETSDDLVVECMARLCPIIQRQAGWQGLTKMTVATDYDKQFALIQDVFHDWSIERQPIVF